MLLILHHIFNHRVKIALVGGCNFRSSDTLTMNVHDAGFPSFLQRFCAHAYVRHLTNAEYLRKVNFNLLKPKKKRIGKYSFVHRHAHTSRQTDTQRHGAKGEAMKSNSKKLHVHVCYFETPIDQKMDQQLHMCLSQNNITYIHIQCQFDI